MYKCQARAPFASLSPVLSVAGLSNTIAAMDDDGTIKWQCREDTAGEHQRRDTEAFPRRCDAVRGELAPDELRREVSCREGLPGRACHELLPGE